MPPPSSTTTRKRPAPGASPAIHPTLQNQQPSFQFNPNSSQLTNDQFLRWGQNAMTNSPATHTDPTADYGGYNGNLLQSSTSSHAQQQPLASTQLARRPINQDLVARASRLFPDGDDGLTDYGDGLMDLQGENGQADDDDDIDALERRATIAKREAQAKNKKIPPFVQKLSSFLDESRNTDLIRWSDDGDSFIVLDEDEFARTLIPELFKHSNYASFVRQLNMYGFHKKVGLSDNSMRASERRNKSPSEYANRFFKRGHPNLLWLINKPKNPNPLTKGTKDGKGSDEGIAGQPDGRDVSVGPNEGHSSEGPADGGKQMVTAGQDLADVRQQLQSIQQQQRVISSAINRLRKDHNQIYDQAAAFQLLHDRHETSINAILTFLATVYNRSLEGHGGQNLANMVANAIPQDVPSQRGMVDVGPLGTTNNVNQGQRVIKRQQLLLGPPSMAGRDGQSGRATTVSPAASAATPQDLNAAMTPTSEGHAVDDDGMDVGIFDSRHPTVAGNPQSQVDVDGHGGLRPETDIMSIINTANNNLGNQAQAGQGGPQLDFSTALTQYQNGNVNSPLTPLQRNEILNLMAQDTNAGRDDTALISSSLGRMANISQLGISREELDLLSKLQAEQDSKVQQLANMIQPLSPTGSIPGLATDGSGNVGGGGSGPYDAPGPLDLDQIFSSGDYFTADDLNNNNIADGDDAIDDTGTGFDFPFDPEDGSSPVDQVGRAGAASDNSTGASYGGRAVGTVNSSEATSPATTIHGVDESGADGNVEAGRSPPKRRRRN